jgi:hypothetical protein
MSDWTTLCNKGMNNMRRQFVVGFLVLALSAVAVAGAGASGRSDGRSCTTQRFGAVIQALGAKGVALKVPDQVRALTFPLLARTQIRKQDRPVAVTALAVGQQVVAVVRTCQGGGGPTEVALVSITVVGGDSSTVGGTPVPAGPPAPPPTVAPACARGDFTAPVAVVGADSISFTSNGAEGLKTFSVGVTGDTAIVKSGGPVSLTALQPGDRLHVWVVRCQGAPPTLRATRIVDLGPATVTTPPPTTGPPATN